MYKPNEQETKILELVAQGNIFMAELIDITGLGGEVLNHSIEALDQNRYIRRAGFVGGNFWTFSISKKGLEALPEMSELEKEFHELGLWPTDLDTLELFNKHSGVLASQCIYTNIEGSDKQLAAIGSMVKLIRLGYIREFGFVRRKVELSDSGKQLLSKHRTID